MSDGQEAVKQFRRVVREVSELADATIGTEPLEPGLRRLVEIIEAHPDDLDQLKTEFVQLVDNFPPGTIEILQFAMYRYRWEEVKFKISSRIECTEDRRMKTALRSILDAFDPEWEDRDIFAAYRDDS